MSVTTIHESDSTVTPRRVQPVTLGTPHRGQDDGADYVTNRLRGTVWQHSASAHVLYRGVTTAARALGRAGVSADCVTYSSLLLAVAAGFAASRGGFMWAALLVLSSGVLDILDGAVARETRTISPFGALLDSTLDRLSDAAPLVGITIQCTEHGAAVALPALAMVSSFAISYVRARAESLRVSAPVLFMRRPERVLLLSFTFVLGGILPTLTLLLVGLAVMTSLNMAAVLVALRAARRARACDSLQG